VVDYLNRQGEVAEETLGGVWGAVSRASGWISGLEFRYLRYYVNNCEARD